MKIIKLVISGIVIMLLVSCMAWHKPNATQGEFERDRYQCLQESQQRVGVATVGAYGGSAVNTVQTNDMLFGTCMNARGWTLQNKQALESQLMQQQAGAVATQTQAQQDNKRLEAKADAICANPSYKLYYDKSPCKANEATFEQMADGSKITPAQKLVLVKQRGAISEYQKEQISLNKGYGGKASKIATAYEVEILPQQDQLNLDLYNGKITWGDYNKQRKEINTKFQEKIKSL